MNGSLAPTRHILNSTRPHDRRRKWRFRTYTQTVWSNMYILVWKYVHFEFAVGKTHVAVARQILKIKGLRIDMDVNHYDETIFQSHNLKYLLWAHVYFRFVTWSNLTVTLNLFFRPFQVILIQRKAQLDKHAQ